MSTNNSNRRKHKKSLRLSESRKNSFVLSRRFSEQIAEESKSKNVPTTDADEVEKKKVGLLFYAFYSRLTMFHPEIAGREGDFTD